MEDNISLDPQTGKLDLAGLIFLKSTTPSDIEDSGGRLVLENFQYTTYKLSLLDHQLAANIRFESIKIKSISIALGEVHSEVVYTPLERNALLPYLTRLGGQQEYGWGRLKLFQDLKAGGCWYIILSYN